MADGDVRAAACSMGVVWEGLAGALGESGLEAVDEDVRDYCCAVLEADGDALTDADAVFEAVGEILLDAAAGALDESTLRAACQAAWQPTDGAAEPAKLARGFVIGDEEEARVFENPSAKAAREKAKALITPVAEPAVPDEARALRRQRKEGRAQAAAQQRLQAELQATAPRPEILRNVGGPRNQDLHLENLSVSNGGAELIQVRRRRASPECSMRSGHVQPATDAGTTQHRMPRSRSSTGGGTGWWGATGPGSRPSCERWRGGRCRGCRQTCRCCTSSRRSWGTPRPSSTPCCGATWNAGTCWRRNGRCKRPRERTGTAWPPSTPGWRPSTRSPRRPKPRPFWR